MTYYTGIDLHCKYAKAVMKDKEGNLIKEARINLEDEQQTIDFFKKENPTDKQEAVLEPVSFWYPYYELLEQKCHVNVHLAHPLKVKAIASARIKTDKIDANVLADLLRTNLLPEAYIPSFKERQLKELLRLRVSLVCLQTQVKNKIHGICHKNGLINGFSDLFGKQGLEWLNTRELKRPFDLQREQYLILLRVLRETIKRVNEQIRKEVKHTPLAKLLMTIPEIGYFSALTILAEIGDIARFPSSNKLCGYTGLAPSTYSSGGKTRHGRITRQGSRYLRWILTEAAQKQGKHNSKLGIYYQRIKKKKGTAKAKVATARKIIKIVYAILITGQPYRLFPCGRETRRSPFHH